MRKAAEKGEKESPEKNGPHPVNRSALRRLKIIEGQIRGIQKMIVEEKYCVDIINQISAARSALNNVGTLILRRHIDRCVTNAIKNNGQNSREVIDELMTLLSKEEI